MNNYFFKATLLAFLVIADSGTLMSKNNHVLNTETDSENTKRKSEISGVIKDTETGVAISWR